MQARCCKKEMACHFSVISIKQCQLFDGNNVTTACPKEVTPWVMVLNYTLAPNLFYDVFAGLKFTGSGWLASARLWWRRLPSAWALTKPTSGSSSTTTSPSPWRTFTRSLAGQVGGQLSCIYGPICDLCSAVKLSCLNALCDIKKEKQVGPCMVS